jgi:hypothetical protein
VTLIVIASTTAAAGTSATAGTSAATATGTATATTAWRASAIRLGTGFVNVQCAPTQFLAIECGNGLLGFGGIRHFDERKAAGTAGVAIGHDADLFDSSMRFEQCAQLCF